MVALLLYVLIAVGNVLIRTFYTCCGKARTGDDRDYPFGRIILAVLEGIAEGIDRGSHFRQLLLSARTHYRRKDHQQQRYGDSC